ncbi:hypothetical protein BIY27_16470 [Gibbsiella quercinecans]|uniref:FAD-dependent oxidoreductase n=1 Tax=Gibbsiella quercinecans TaxID=929813 RepID=UPI000EF1B452|nr:BBE domain-containing protein [Gibbsiella quercinecans]RLM08924.1 hypothetical protein BIY27_16470 [Gibbsiella quercinecans]
MSKGSNRIPENLFTRRAILVGAAGVALGTASVALGASITSGRITQTRPRQENVIEPSVGATEIYPGDPRYSAFQSGINNRFVGRPDVVKIVRGADDAARGLQEAVDKGTVVGIRSGGHCASDFIAHDGIRTLFDLSPLNIVDFDADRDAYVVGAGARLFEVYDSLYRNHRVTLPGGVCHSVGIGGHVAGGGYGFLSRQFGLVVDHLRAVEVTHVDNNGNVNTTIATNDPNDPAYDLWWAHTGGGGGNFGIVTRYWFHTPNAERGLIEPPSKVLVRAIDFPWNDLDESRFKRLLANFSTWHELNSDPGSPHSHLSTLFNINSIAHGHLSMFIQIDASVASARAIVDDFVRIVCAGVSEPRPMSVASGELGAMPRLFETTEIPWWQAVRMTGAPDVIGLNPDARIGIKSAYFRSHFTDTHLSAIYRYLSDENYGNPDASIVLLSYGGAINAKTESESSSAQRDSVIKALFLNIWSDANDDATHLQWIRGFYADTFADTDGVPAIDGVTDGAYINYPDSDLADVRYNKSMHQWHELYYKRNYPRLQQVKRVWDPKNIFRHSLSIRS